MKITFAELLALLLIGLKLTNYIDWSWWFVLMPLFLPIVIALLIIAVAVITGSFIGMYSVIKKERYK